MEEDQKDQENKGVCRQSSTRWTPTPDQIRILKDLYYSREVRSPNGEQIQSICSTLRQYGKIEGKNVFYWFQNHKARERQKKRFTSDHHHHHPTTTIPYNKPPYTANYITSPSAPPGFFTASTSSSPSGLPTYAPYASLTMDKTFREGYSGVHNSNYGGWVEPYNHNNGSCYSFFDMQKTVNETLLLQEEEEEDHQDVQNDDDEHDQEMMIETLPLFPTQREEFIGSNSNNNSCYSYTNSWYATSDHHDYNALELTLNSYTTSHRGGGPHY